MATNGVERWETAGIEYYYDVVPDVTTWGTTNRTTWYVVSSADVTIASRIMCQGDVRLVLKDGCKLTAAHGIVVMGGNSLTVYGQEGGTGALTATGAHGSSGIGGDNFAAGENITINGGTVTATGTYGAAGIGGGCWGAGENITINGGTVTATGGKDIKLRDVDSSDGAGIGGGGCCGTGSNIHVNPTALLVKANGTAIDNDGGDLAAKLAGKQYVTITPCTQSVGENLTAMLQNGTCTISGEGAMAEVMLFHSNGGGNALAVDLFETERANINRVIIGSGVTSVAAERFCGFPALSNVTVAASVRRIGAGAFANCPSLARVDFLGDELPTIEDEALVFTTSIEMKDGVPVVAPSMVITVGGRMPTLMGTKALGAAEAWEPVAPGHEAAYRFFRYEVK